MSRDHFLPYAEEVIRRCRTLANCTEEQGRITRRFLSPPMRQVHSLVRDWMERLQMDVVVDAAGNIRGVYEGLVKKGSRLIIGSHLDTVPNAGPFDGILGVIIGISLVELLNRRRLANTIEVIGFSEEEGVRFSAPFLGSLACIGELNEQELLRTDIAGITVAEALREFGLDPTRIADARIGSDVIGYLEFHIEQGPVLDGMHLPLAVVEAIAGQSRSEFTFEGNPNHAGTTPMNYRRDALSGAAEWISAVERDASATKDLVATVGKLNVEPGVGNVIPGIVRASLDVRHGEDAVRKMAVHRLIEAGEGIAQRRGLHVGQTVTLDHQTVPMDRRLTSILARSIEALHFPLYRMTSGAGHDAMVIARKVPAAMLFLRSPGGLSHHPDESVILDDVAAALEVGLSFLEDFGKANA